MGLRLAGTRILRLRNETVLSCPATGRRQPILAKVRDVLEFACATTARNPACAYSTTSLRPLVALDVSSPWTTTRAVFHLPPDWLLTASRDQHRRGMKSSAAHRVPAWCSAAAHHRGSEIQTHRTHDPTPVGLAGLFANRRVSSWIEILDAAIWRRGEF